MLTLNLKWQTYINEYLHVSHSSAYWARSTISTKYGLKISIYIIFQANSVDHPDMGKTRKWCNLKALLLYR